MVNFLVKGKSSIHGKGIFTNKKINKNTVFYIVPENNLFNKPKPRRAFIGNNTWVNDSKILKWVNHSCSPNAILRVYKKPICLIAKKKIDKGEEITCDYNKTEKCGIRASCNCNSRKCKKFFLRVE